MVKYIRQRHKEQIRTASRIYTIAETSREYNQSRHKCHKSIQYNDPDSFPGKSLFLSYIAPENSQRPNSKRKSKEGLSHGCKNNFLRAIGNKMLPVRKQIICQPLVRPWEKHGINCQNNQKHQQTDHHHLGNPFYPFLESHIANAKTAEHYSYHIQCHRQRVSQKSTKHIPDAFCIKAIKTSGNHLVYIVKHPAGNCRIEHHKQHIACNGPILIPVPLGSFGLQSIEGTGHTHMAPTAHREFTYHNRQPQNR